VSLRSLVRKATSHDKAVYWAAGPLDPYSKVTYLTAVEVGVRWDDTVETFTGLNGQIQVSKAMVLMEPDFDIEPKGVLWHGKLVDLTDPLVPINNKGSLEIRGIRRIPDFENSFVAITALL